MKKITLIIALAFASSAAFLSSCSKYEEGPNFTLSSKKARLAGEWKATSIVENGTAYNLSNFGYDLDLERNGDYTLVNHYIVFGINYSATTTGTWEFSSDKLMVTMTPTDPNVNQLVFKIIRLAKDQLKFDEMNLDPGNTREWVLEPR